MSDEMKDPLDVSAEPELVKDAQKEISKIDVLVCGGCHEIFHFVDEFQEHKQEGKCSQITGLKCENEEKFQIWAFTLWKTKEIQTYKSKGEELPTSWQIYQKWTKLEPDEKSVWMVTGKRIQFIHKLATGKVTDAKEEKDPLAVDEDSVSNETSKTGVRTMTENEEYNVEKILGKRFNPRRRYWEYEVKWENYSEHTWEPLLHLENSKELVKEFEDKLKADKEKLKTPGRGRGRPRLNPNAPTPVKVTPKKVDPPAFETIIPDGPPGSRPQRSSKQKALNQVKQWCGSISDEEGGTGKRSYDDDDYESDESFEKKIKMEAASDSEDDDTKSPARKVAKIIHTYNNGTGKKLPDNVLIPDARGVVRISQKQLPSLSSGVYIMSKSSGIIKLDPTASKIATSGGQAIVKVNPKVGQTQIKIIKKEDGAKRVIQVKPGENLSPSTAALAVAQAVTACRPKILQIAPQGKMIVKKEPLIVKKPEVKSPIAKVEKKEPQVTTQIVKKPPAKPVKPTTLPPVEDDSDDGIPDLEFPKDLPPPSPESPPREFTLDPLTGKVAGVEYPSPSPPPVINENAGKAKAMIKSEAERKPEEEKKANDSLDNIVKLAAADITEDDLKIEPETPVTTGNKTIVAVPSILATAMANSNILQKTLQNPSPRPKTQPRIINQSVARPRPTAVTTVKVPPPKPVVPRPKYNVSSASPVRSPLAKGNVAKRIGNTTVYRTAVATTSTPQILRKPIKKSPVAQHLSQKPISMPSLEEESPTQVVVAAPSAVEQPELSAFTIGNSDRPVFITGDDGTIYQVAGQNEEGQTILLAHDSDGQQQCLLVTSEAVQEEGLTAGTPTTVEGTVQTTVTAGEDVALQVATETEEEQPLVAQFIRSEPPSPGGTHKVVVMLPDGDVMVTQVTPEEYASLELDK